MSWAGRRRLTYFFMVLLILGAILVASLFIFVPEPTCFDGQKNQNELGIDCGGICKAVCASEARDLNVGWSRIIPLTDNIYETATLVENPNRDLGVIDATYTIRYFDRENLIINKRSDKISLLPSEKFVIFDQNIDVGRRIPTKAVFDWTGSAKWYRPNKAKPEITWVSKGFTQTDPPLLKAEVTNKSLAPVSGLIVVATVSDVDENVMAVSSTLVESLDAGESREVAFSWPKVFPRPSALIELFPHQSLPLTE